VWLANQALELAALGSVTSKRAARRSSAPLRSAGLLTRRNGGRMNNVARWLESLPAEALFALVMALSAVVAALCLRIRLPIVRWALALVIPFVIAWCLYWMPVWVGNDPSEYAAWAPLFIVLWGLSGAVASLLVFIAKRTMTRARTR
jgi:hypothetical protein